MVVLMKRMFELGFWMQSEDTLRDLIGSILALLDPSTEVAGRRLFFSFLSPFLSLFFE
jgi:hypothetical protein